MRGYHGLPDQTAEALDPDGWLHTGDVGHVDGEGYLAITDRKKDLIKTSGGKYVAPAELESRIKTACPLLSQVLVHGDRRSFVTALVTLDPEAARKWAAANGLEDRDLAALSQLPELRAVLQRGFEKVNAALPRFATVKKFRVVPAEFTEAAGEVTASQKLKRKVIEARHREELDAMYGESPAQVLSGGRRGRRGRCAVPVRPGDLGPPRAWRSGARRPVALTARYHARVLPGERPDAASRELKDRAEIVRACIYAGDIEPRRCAPQGITYDSDALKLIDDLVASGS